MCYASVPSRVTSGPRLDVAGEQLMPLLQLRTQSSQLLQVVLQQLACPPSRGRESCRREFPEKIESHYTGNKPGNIMAHDGPWGDRDF